MTKQGQIQGKFRVSPCKAQMKVFEKMSFGGTKKYLMPSQSANLEEEHYKPACRRRGSSIASQNFLVTRISFNRDCELSYLSNLPNFV